MLEKLPNKWCIRLALKEINDAVNSINLWEFGKLVWDSQPNYINRYITYNGLYISREQLPDFTEISFDDFKKLVLKEKSPEELLIEEAKLRYPIGTEFYSALPGDLNPSRLKCWGGYRFQEDVHGCKNVIWNKDHNNRECGFLYCNGVWAEIINKNTMCTEKTIKLSLDQARKMYGKSPEMDELLLANFSKEELTKKELPKSWNEARPNSGYKISYGYNGAYIEKLPTMNRSKYENKAIFTTEKQAKSALAAAQLSQLMAVYNDGWEPIWNYTNNRSNWCIVRSGDELKWQNVGQTYSFLAFKSLEICDEFLKNFKPLIKEYFMID